jgi:hypothetical protein
MKKKSHAEPSNDPAERRRRLEKLNDPFAGDVPAIPKFDGSLAPRHFLALDHTKIMKVPSRNNMSFS